MTKLNSSEIELAETPVKSGRDNVKTEVLDSEVQNEPESVSIATRLKSVITFFTVEPFLLLYLLPKIISSVTISKLNLDKACRADLGYPQNQCALVSNGEYGENETDLIAASTQAQVLVAEMTGWQQPIQSGIPAIVILFVGAWSDRTGNRKALMLIPIFGELLSTLGLILSTYYFHWPLFVNGLMEAIPTAFTGGFSIALMGSYSFIADVTTVESRTFRMGCLAIIVTLGIPLGTSISGVLTETIGYFGILGIDVVMYGFGLLYVLFRIKDVRSEPMEGSFKNKLIEFFHPKNAWDTLSLLFMSRNIQLIQIVLVIWAHIVIMGPVFGETGVLFLYLLGKYHMTIIEYAFFQTYTVFIGLAGTAVAVTVFSKLLKMQDSIIGIIATSSRVVGSFMYALAPSKQWLYSAPVLDFFGTTGSTAIRSLGTKVVSPEKVGKMCSLIGFVEAVAPVIYTPIYTNVYAKTLTTFPGTFYILGGTMTIPAIFIFIMPTDNKKDGQRYGVTKYMISQQKNALYYITRKSERDTVTNPDEKEAYAYENEVTVI